MSTQRLECDHVGGLGAGLERLPGGGDRGGPHALEQVADLLDAGDVLLEQLLAAHAEVAEPVTVWVLTAFRLRSPPDRWTVVAGFATSPEAL